MSKEITIRLDVINQLNGYAIEIIIMKWKPIYNKYNYIEINNVWEARIDNKCQIKMNDMHGDGRNKYENASWKIEARLWKCIYTENKEIN